MQMSIDGFVAGPNGEMDWMVWNWDEVIKTHTAALTESCDTILLGRKTAEGMTMYWPAVSSNPEASDEDRYMAEKMNGNAKFVFSKTISELEWSNTTVVQDDIITAVNKIKKQPGKDIITYGGAGFVSSLIRFNLIDEYHLFVNPAILGNGMAIFKTVTDRLNLKLVNSTTGSCGIVILQYEPVSN